MHLERKVEATIKAALVAGLANLIEGVTVTVRTYWDEDYSTREESVTAMPCVLIIAGPSSRPVLAEPQRVIPVDIQCATQSEDDLDRRHISAIYSRVRHLMETTEWDFGALTVYGGIEIPAPGSADMDEASSRWIASFAPQIHLCAESSEAHE